MGKKVVHSVFEEIVRKKPLNVAIETEHSAITYAGLNLYANRINGLLKSIECRTGTIVNVVMSPSIGLVASMLAIFKAGAIYLPVDLSSSEKRIAQIFNDTSGGIVVSSVDNKGPLLELIQLRKIRVTSLIVLDEEGRMELNTWQNDTLNTSEAADLPEWKENSPAEVDGNTSNYIFYTSGSTGDAKAILGLNASLSHFIHWEMKEFSIDETYRISQLTQITFDASLRDILVPLLAGGTLCIPARELRNNPLKLLQWISRSRITLIHCVPSLFRVLTRELQSGRMAVAAFDDLRFILMAGELLYAKDILEWRKGPAGHVRLVNLYGATETTLIKTFYRIENIPDNPAQAIPVGIPISNTSVAIIKGGQVCKTGEIGEVYVKTPFMTKGYYNNDSLTGECFVQNPLVSDARDIVYKTGDLGRYLPDGNMEILGRLDSQVKINGIRVELGEVEKAMMALENITGVVVKTHRTEDNFINLVAYYTGREAEVSSMREALRPYLNEQIIPFYFIHLESFPLNMNGKVDKKLLPVPEEVIMGGVDFEPPAGDIECKLEIFWKEILGYKRVGRNISFFNIGGHSLRAIQLVARIHAAFGIDIKIADIFNHATIRELAQFIKTGSLLEFTKINRIPDQPYYALSSAQRRLWVLCQIEEGNIAYNMPGLYVFEGDLNDKALQYAFEKMIERHEILRTVFRADENGDIRQFILKREESGFEIGHIEVPGDVSDAKSISESIYAEVMKPFSLDTSPLIRARLIRVGSHKWVFAYAMHHIISDAWSMNILIRELLSFYNGYQRNEGIVWQPLAIQYRDYAVWQQEQLGNGSMAKHKQYWLEQFSGELPLLDFPNDQPRPAVKTYRGGSVRRKIDARLNAGLQDIGNEQGATLFMCLLAAVNALLHRYTNQEDIIIGCPVAGRNHVALEDQIGFYVNTLAMRTRFNGQDSFRDLLDKVKFVALKAYEFQAYPFDELVDDLKLQRDMSRSVLFDVVLVLQNALGSDPANMETPAGLSVSRYEEVGNPTSKFELVFNFAESGGDLLMAIEYNSDIFNESSIERLADHFGQLLAAIIDEPAIAIGHLNYLTADQQARLFPGLHQKEVSWPGSETVVSLFEEQARLHPGRMAVKCEDRMFTYQALNELSNQLADYLRRKYHIAPDDLVGINLDRNEWLMVAILGTLKSGGAYLPIDPEYPDERKAFMISDSGCKVVITKTELSEFIENRLDFSTDNLPPVNGPADLAYVIYTSGTTGKPKGTLVEHRNIVRLLINDGQLFNFSENDVWTMFHSYSFDFSVWEMYGALLFGGRLIIVPALTARDPEAFRNLLDHEGVTVLNQTPSAFYSLAEQDLKMNDSLAALRYVIFGGEALSPARLDKWKHKYPFVSLINMYGITETTVHVTYKEIGEKEIAANSRNIGVPIPTMSCYVLDPYRLPVPIGVPGELYVGGEGVARGYLNRESLTRERFIDNSFQKGGRLYRSGDKVKQLENGDLEYMGRMDQQVKIRGHRIELGEIENTLRRQTGIDEAVVLAKPDQNGENEIIVYITGDDSINTADTMASLAKELPRYMLPSRIIRLIKIPLTANGKVDKKALPEAENDLLRSGTAYVGPRNETESHLVAVYEEVLRRRPISVKDDFFVMGGDSIKSIQVIARVKQRGYSLTIRDVMQYPVVEDLARQMKIVVRSIDQGLTEGPVIFGPVQEYFFATDPVHINHFNQSVLLAGKKDISEAAIRSALEALMLHHDALRMVCRRTGAGWVLYNDGIEQKCQFEVMDEPDDGSFRERCDLIQSGMDLEKGPLLKAVLFRRAAGDTLLLVAHHLVIDGVSWRILFEDLSSLYQQFLSEQPLLLPLKTDSFQYWQNQLLLYSQSKQLAKEEPYWSAMESLGVQHLPLKNREGSNKVKDEASCSFMLDEVMTNRLLTECYHAYHTEINDILLTALSLAVKEIFDIGNVLVMLEGHGRENIGVDIDISRTVGWFTALYPVSFAMDHFSNPVRQLIEVKERLHRLPNKGIGYGVLKYLAKKEYKLKPEISFNYLGDFGSGLETGRGEPIFSFSGDYQGRRIAGNRERGILLDVLGIVAEGKMLLSVGYSSEQFDRDIIQKLTDCARMHLTNLITLLSEEKKTRLSPFDLTYKDLSMEQLMELDPAQNVEDVYPLSPMQLGLYYQWLMAPESTDYFEQISYCIEGHLDLETLEKSYHRLVSRHAILRTFFTQDFASIPLQVVRHDIGNTFSFVSDLSVSNSSIEAFKAVDRTYGFDLHKGSLMRLTVIKLAEERYEFVWSHHHILMDGWCISILINEFFQLYESLLLKKAPGLENVYRYSDYIEWLGKVDRTATLLYWKNYLAGYDTISTLPKNRFDAEAGYTHERISFALEDEVRKSIRSLCGELGVTENTFVQTVWAILLSEYNSTDDVVFGSVVSGRPGELRGVEQMIGLFSNTIPVRIAVKKELSFSELLRKVQDDSVESAAHHYVQLSDVLSESELGRGLFDHIMIFENYPLLEMVEQSVEKGDAPEPLKLLSASNFERNNYDFTVSIMPREKLTIDFVYNGGLYERQQMVNLRDHLVSIITNVLLHPEKLVGAIDYLSDREKHLLLHEFNDTFVDYSRKNNLIDLFEQQADRTPEKTALIFEETALTYRELDERANQLSDYLKKKYPIAPDDLIGIKLPRSEWTVIAILGIWKSGAAYMPVDPGYPEDRIVYMLKDSDCRMLIDEAEISNFCLHAGECTTARSKSPNNPDDSAYVIYTSGSTGRPKGVRVAHRNVVNFFAGMNTALGSEPGTMLAVTNYTFDISVLELIWTLTLGFKVVIQKDVRDIAPAASARTLKDFSLFYFGNADIDDALDKYRLLIDGARYADNNGYTAVWTPERHFHEFGGLYPSPSLTGAAIAGITRNISIRAGSVVLPLNNPLRVAEEWSVVDNLSGGRVGIACASGWHANDFVLSPGNFKGRQQIMYDMIDTIRKLWNGQSVSFADGNGKQKETRIFPRPIQKELPLWITSAGTKETFISAGKLGFNLLTHMLGSTLEELAVNIRAYRTAYKENGHEQTKGAGKVAVMLHTYIGDSLEATFEKAKKPFIAYLRSSLGLIRNLAVSMGYDMSSEEFTEQNLEDVLEYSFDRYVNSSSLIGTKETCMAMLEKIDKIGVDEVACLIDFGIDYQATMESLEYLTQLKDEYRAEAEDFSILGQVKRHQVTHLQSTPSLAALINAELEDGHSFGTLKKILLGGEKLPLSLVNDLFRKIPSADIYNMYGPTETTIWSTCAAISRYSDKITIGRPIANTNIYILNDRMGLLPAGITGEIYIGGKGVVRSYVNRPEMSKERFLRNPYLPGDRLYRTGDYGKWLPDGSIEYVGRKDDQVKIRGYRIELEEIEKALLANEKIESAVVVANKRKGDQELVAYIVGKEQLHTNELYLSLGKFLPDYMIPGHFVQLDELPLTFNGKLNRNALPDPGERLINSGIEYAPARNRTEEKLISLWKEILGREKIGVFDDFFKSGGNSIRSMQLISRIRKDFDVKLELKALFEKTVLEDQAKMIEKAERTSFYAIPAVPEQTSYVLSYAQLRLWISSQFEEGNIAYNNPGVHLFEGNLDRESLEYSFNALIERHEILRTVFREDEQGAVKQFILAPSDSGFRMIFEDMRSMKDRDSKIKDLTFRAYAKPFDLASGPLISAELYRVEDDKWVFIYVMHHIISDGWSMNILINELMKLYNAWRQGKEAQLPILRIQYKDYAVWQHSQLRAGLFDRHRAYWLSQFQGELPVLKLKNSRPRPRVKTYTGGIVKSVINPKASLELKAVSLSQGATLFMSLVAIVNILLNRHTDQEDIIVGTPVAGRDHLDLEDQIGLYLNTLAIRTKLRKENTFTGLLESVRQVTLDGYEHQIYPFDELIKGLNLQRDLSRSVLFDVWIVLHNTDIHNMKKEKRMDGLRTGDYEGGDSPFTKFDLLFSFMDTEDGIKTSIEYNRDIVNRKDAEDMLLEIEHTVAFITQFADKGIVEVNEYLDRAIKEAQTEYLQKSKTRNLESLKNY